MQTLDQIPTDYKRVRNHDTLCLHNEDENITITVAERDESDPLHNSYPYKVIGTQDEKQFHESVTQTRSEAQQQALALAVAHPL